MASSFDSGLDYLSLGSCVNNASKYANNMRMLVGRIFKSFLGTDGKVNILAIKASTQVSLMSSHMLVSYNLENWNDRP